MHRLKIKRQGETAICFHVESSLISAFCLVLLYFPVLILTDSLKHIFLCLLRQVLDIISYFSLWEGLINPATAVLVSSALGANMDANLSL